jgi:hypothetical protein
MKSSWIGIGFSHHSVPSLSNTAKRSSTATGSDPSAPQTRATNASIDCFAGPSRQLDSLPTTPPDARSVVAMNRTVRTRPGPRITPTR